MFYQCGDKSSLLGHILSSFSGREEKEEEDLYCWRTSIVGGKKKKEAMLYSERSTAIISEGKKGEPQSCRIREHRTRRRGRGKNTLDWIKSRKSKRNSLSLQGKELSIPWNSEKKKEGRAELTSSESVSNFDIKKKGKKKMGTGWVPKPKEGSRL